MRQSQYSQPYFVSGLRESDTAIALPKIRLAKPGDDPESQEFRLQSFIMRHPTVLPIAEIEQALVPIVPVCMELPTRSDLRVDNLFVTPNGDLILVECKLWHNYESRRQVIVQILEYGKEISTWTYTELQSAIRKGSYKHLSGSEPPPQTLYDFVKSEPDPLEERDFVDAVSRSLRRGRFLLLVVGDGIHESLEDLADYVQLHAGLHFTLGLVDIAIFQVPAGGFYLQPRVIARTVNIDRGIVSIRDGQVIVEPPPQKAGELPRSGRRTTITEDKFYEALARVDPEVPERLRSFMAELESLNVESDFGQSSLVLRWRAGGDAKWNFGTINTAGKLWTDMLGIQAKQFGRPDLGQAYLERLSAIVPGLRIKQSKVDQPGYLVKPNGSIPEISGFMATPERMGAWRSAIGEFIEAVSEANDGGNH
jgi:hypothetical protein